MIFSLSLSSTLLLASSLLSTVSAQTSTKCQPLTQSCPADPALGRSINVEFASGASSEFTADGSSITYNSNGAQLQVATSGNSPTFISKWYIMFGRVDVVMQSAPGVGMVSSIVLQSDDLDEIDWEMLGSQPSQAQTNYFGKGQTGTYNRGLTISDPTSTAQFNTYTIDWNADRIIWEINGVPLRTLAYADAAGQFPQTPCQLKVGSWAPGDPSNAAGTVQWAGGSIDYSQGLFNMLVKSISVQDYSTGTQYSYGGESGSWQSIVATGGSVGSQGAGSGSSSGGSGTYSSIPSVPSESPTQVTSVPGAVESQWTGTHKETGSVTHTGWPWVGTAGANPATTSTSSTFFGAYSSGASARPTSTLYTQPSSASSSQQPYACEAVTTMNMQGYPTVIYQPAGFSTMSKSYDSHGWLVTPTCTTTAPSSTAPIVVPTATTFTTLTSLPARIPTTPASSMKSTAIDTTTVTTASFATLATVPTAATSTALPSSVVPFTGAAASTIRLADSVTLVICAGVMLSFASVFT